jgi:hypothetical protein
LKLEPLIFQVNLSLDRLKDSGFDAHNFLGAHGAWDGKQYKQGQG